MTSSASKSCMGMARPIQPRAAWPDEPPPHFRRFSIIVLQIGKLDFITCKFHARGFFVALPNTLAEEPLLIAPLVGDIVRDGGIAGEQSVPQPARGGRQQDRLVIQILFVAVGNFAQRGHLHRIIIGKQPHRRLPRCL